MKLWRSIVATVALVLNRSHGQLQVDEHRARTGRWYIEHHDLGFWDSRNDGGGWGFSYLLLYPGWRIEAGNEWESSM